jgi:hypothetical protein
MLELPTITDPSVQVGAEDETAETSEARRRKFRARLVEEQKGQGRRLTDSLKSLRDYYASLDADARLKRNVDTDLMVRYLNGDTYGEHNAQGVWERYTLSDGDFAYSIPVLVGHVEQALSQLLKTRLEYEFQPHQTGNSDMRAVARMSEALANEDYEGLLGEDERQEEILNTLIAGESPRYLYWGESGKKVSRVSFASTVKSFPARRECRNCRAEVPSPAKSCPSCGVTYLEEVEGAKTLLAVAKGEDEVSLGHNRLHIPKPMSVQYDLSARGIHESTFVVERDTLPRKVAEWTYQTIIQDGRGLSEEMRLQREQERMSVQTDATVGSARQAEWGASSRSEPVERSRHFCDVVEYGTIYLDEDETLPSGRVLQKGKLLGEHFPDGLYFCFVGDTLVEVEPCRKNRKWSLVRYGKRAGTNRGAGMQHGIALQDVINDSFNLTYATGMTVGHPLTIVNRKHAPELPDANNIIYVNKGDVDVRSVATRIQGSATSSVVDATAERIQQALQFILGTQSVMGQVGAPDAKAMGTATGVAATVENAAMRMSGPIGQRIAADKELRFQLLENIQDFSAPEQWKELARRFGPDTVEAFKKCNLRLELSQKIVPNTDRPRSQALTQATLLALGQIAPALSQVPWGNELLSLLGDVAGVPLEVGPGRTDRREAERRLNKVAAIVEKMGETDATFLTRDEEAAEKIYALLAKFCGPLVVLPDEEMEDAALFLQEHATFQDVYKDALFSEEASVWPRCQKLVVIQMWRDHYEATIEGQIRLEMLKAKLAESLAPKPPPVDPQAPLREKAAGLVEEGLKREADEEAKDEDVRREMMKEEHRVMLEREQPEAVVMA